MIQCDRLIFFPRRCKISLLRFSQNFSFGKSSVIMVFVHKPKPKGVAIMHEDHHHHGHESPDQGPHEHEHAHNHPYPHSHSHPHTHGPPDIARIKTLLGYMLEHNREHAGELGSLAHELRHAGLDGAADTLDDGVKDFDRGNEKLAEALDRIQGENP
jgi:hypothetical protein